MKSRNKALSTGHKYNAIGSLIVLFLVFFISFFSTTLSGQKILDFDKLSLDDGFSSNKANAILQDRQGFIWIGTWNGLNRYDGYGVEVFKPGYHDTTSISNREVLALMEDHLGNIWVGTTSGLNKFDPVSEKWKTYPFQYRIISIFEDRQNIIWIGTWNGGLYRLDDATGEIIHFLENEIISDIHEDSGNNLWIATYYGLINFDRNTSGYNRYLPNKETPDRSISHAIVTQIEESKDGTLWLGTWGGGLNRVKVHPDRDSLNFIHYTKANGNHSLSSDNIFKLHGDRFGNLWIGSWDAGLSLLAPDQQNEMPGNARFVNYKSDLSNPFGISGNNISAIFVDRTGILWLGSSKIEKTSVYSTSATRYPSTAASGKAFRESPVRSLSCRNGYLWVGTIDDLKLYRFKNGRFEFFRSYPNHSYTHNATQFKSSSVLAILQENDGLWIGTEDAGLIYYHGITDLNKRLGDYRYFNTITNPSLPGNKIGHLVRSDIHRGVIWVGTTQNGIARIDRRDGLMTIKSYRAGPGEDQLSDNNIRALVEDKDGKVWIGTQNGLNCLDPVTEIITRYYYEPGDTNTINDNIINVLFEDSEGDLWIGTNSGLNKKLTQIRETMSPEIYFKGFPGIASISDEIVTNIQEDESGILWVGVYSEIIKLNLSDYSLNEKIVSKDYQRITIAQNTAIKNSDGSFLIGGDRGFIVIHPDSLEQNMIPPKVCITDILISNRTLHEDASWVKDNSVLKAVPYLEKLSLSHKAKVLTFVFSAMDYKNPKQNKYSYKLEGLENVWNDVGTRNTATYTNLKPGDYLFKVHAVNSDGIASESAAELKLVISTPWWRSVMAIVVYSIIIVGLLYFFNQYSIIGAKEKGRIMIEHMEYEKEHEVNEMKSLFFTNITHEFRTPLTLIIGPVEELLKSPDIKDAAKRQIEFIHNNAQRLLRLVNQLIEFRKVETGKMKLHRSKANIADLLNELFESYKGMAVARNIEFTLSLNEQKIDAFVDYEKLEKAYFNLLSNAFKYSENGSRISITAWIAEEGYQERMLISEFADTGIGIPESFHNQVFERFFQVNQSSTQSTGGIGLYLSKTFVEQHGGTIELESEPGKGSCFRVILPVDRLPEEVRELTNNQQELQTEERLHDPIKDQHSSVGSTVDNVLHQVLIVEDDHELNEFLVNGLLPEYSVIGAKDGKEGFELARKHTPDIIITDIMMPVMDGIEMGRLLRKDRSTSHIPLIYLTAKTMQEDEIEGLNIGAVDYIYKPFNLLSLKLKVQNILENRMQMHLHFKAEKLTEPEHFELESLDEKFLKDAVNAVNEHIDDSSFDVEKFSYTIGMSTNQAYRKIKALTGQTANEFIRNQRLKTAASLLVQNRRSISEIIYMVGFSSPSYFTRCFKEYYGCTPKEYIEKKRQD